MSTRTALCAAYAGTSFLAGVSSIFFAFVNAPFFAIYEILAALILYVFALYFAFCGD